MAKQIEIETIRENALSSDSSLERLVIRQPQSIALNEDCMNVMKRYPDKFFALAIVDPPYGIGVGKMPFTRETNRPCRQKNGKTLRIAKKAYKQSEWDNAIPKQNYFDELFRVSQEQIIWGIDYYELTNIGRGRIKWDKGYSEGMSFGRYEKAYCSLIESEMLIEYLWAGMMQAKSTAEPMVQQGNKVLNEKRIHPAQKPIGLYRILLDKFAKRGNNFFDSHLGSGSSRIACHKAGLDFVGCEKDKDYYDAQEKRFANYMKQLPMQFAAV